MYVIWLKSDEWIRTCHPASPVIRPCFLSKVTIICDACMAANATTRCLFVSPLVSCHQVLRLDPRRGCHKQGQRVGLTALTGPVAAVYSRHPGEHAHARAHTLPSCTRQALASIHRGKDPAQSWSKTSISWTANYCSLTKLKGKKSCLIYLLSANDDFRVIKQLCDSLANYWQHFKTPAEISEAPHFDLLITFQILNSCCIIKNRLSILHERDVRTRASDISVWECGASFKVAQGGDGESKRLFSELIGSQLSTLLCSPGTHRGL